LCQESDVNHEKLRGKGARAKANWRGWGSVGRPDKYAASGKSGDVTHKKRVARAKVRAEKC